MSYCTTPLCVYRDLTLFTEPSGGASGQASDIAIHAKEILRVREVLTGIYQKHCAREEESVQDGLDRFRTFSVRCASYCGLTNSLSSRDRVGTGLLHDRSVSSFCLSFIRARAKDHNSPGGARIWDRRQSTREASQDGKCLVDPHANCLASMHHLKSDRSRQFT